MKRKVLRIRRIAYSFLTVFALSVTGIHANTMDTVYATTTEKTQAEKDAEKAQAEADLAQKQKEKEEADKEVNRLQQQTNQLQGEIDSLDAQLVDLLADISVLMIILPRLRRWPMSWSLPEPRRRSSIPI